jgi:glycosyltransferase involved in cell wall biosynthesis
VKIVYVHTVDLSSASPAATFVLHNAEALARAGADVHLVVRDPQGDPARLERRFQLRLPPNLRLHLFPEVARGRWPFYRYAVGELRRIVAKGEPAIVVTRAIGFLPHLVLHRLRARSLRAFFETHDFFMDLSLRSDIRQRRRLRDQWIERLLFPRLDGLLNLSETQRRLYARYLPAERLHVFPSGGREPVAEAPGRSRRNALVYVGSLDPLKGVDQVYAVAARLGPDVELEVIGAKNDAEAEAAHRRAAAAGARVTVHGWVDKERLFELLGEAKLGLLPLRDVFFNRYLTVPLKLFDYYAAGLPVVATDLDSLRELTFGGETGLLVRWEDPDAVAARIREVLADGALYARYRAAVLRRREALGWSRRGRDQVRFFEGVLSATSR